MRIDKARAAATGVEFMDFTWPSPVSLTKCIGDIMDDIVPAKFYLSETIKKGFVRHTEKALKNGNGYSWCPIRKDGVSPCIRARYYAYCATDPFVVLDE